MFRWLFRRRKRLQPGGDHALGFPVRYLENAGREPGAMKWFAIAVACTGNFYDYIAPRPDGYYLRRIVLAGNGETKRSAWYSLCAAIYNAEAVNLDDDYRTRLATEKRRQAEAARGMSAETSGQLPELLPSARHPLPEFLRRRK